MPFKYKVEFFRNHINKPKQLLYLPGPNKQHIVAWFTVLYRITTVKSRSNPLGSMLNKQNICYLKCFHQSEKLHVIVVVVVNVKMGGKSKFHPTL